MQSKYELTDICILHTDPQWTQSWSHFLVLLLPKNISLMDLRFWSWIFHQQGQGFHSVREVREFVRGSGKVWENWYFLEKSQRRKFLSMQFFKKSYACRNVYSWIAYVNQLYMMLLFGSSIKMIILPILFILT